MENLTTYQEMMTSSRCQYKPVVTKGSNGAISLISKIHVPTHVLQNHFELLIIKAEYNLI